MIQSIRTISFGDSSLASEVRETVDKAEKTKERIVEGTVGATTAAAITNGTKIFRGVNGATKVAGETAKNTWKYGKIFTNLLTSMEKVKFLRPLAKFANWGPVKGISLFLGAFTAVGAAAANLANMINVNAQVVKTGQLPSLNLNA